MKRELLECAHGKHFPCFVCHTDRVPAVHRYDLDESTRVRLARHPFSERLDQDSLIELDRLNFEWCDRNGTNIHAIDAKALKDWKESLELPELSVYELWADYVRAAGPPSQS